MDLLITLVVALLVIGLLLYLISLAPIDARIRNAITAIVIVFVIIWLIQRLGLLANLNIR